MRYLLNGHSLRLNPELCNGCGRCQEVCPHAVFSVERRKAEIADRGACMECGACRMNCPTGAIFVESGTGCAQLVLNSMWSKDRTRTECGCGL